MWRSCNVSYTRYAAEMAALLRQVTAKCPHGHSEAKLIREVASHHRWVVQCLKEPYRTQALQRNQIHVKETIYQHGQVVSRETFEDVKKAFEAAAKKSGK